MVCFPCWPYHYAAGQQEKRRAAFRLGCTLSLAFALLCLVTFELFAPQLASLFIDDPATIHYSAGFLRRMVIAMPMMSLCYPMIIQFQAMGKARESLVCSILRKGVLDIPLLFLLDTWLPLLRLYVGTAHRRHHLSDRQPLDFTALSPERGCFPIKNLRREVRCGGFLS